MRLQHTSKAYSIFPPQHKETKVSDTQMYKEQVF